MNDLPLGRRKLYGRRKGPKLSAHQQRLLGELLPFLELTIAQGLDPKLYFLPPPTRGGRNAERSESISGGGNISKAPHPLAPLASSPQGGGEGHVEDVWLEVGFGGGEHLAWQAQANPHVGIIGAEPFVNGVAKLLSKLDSLSPGTGGEGWGLSRRSCEAAKPDEGATRPHRVTPSSVFAPTALRRDKPQPSPPHSWGRGRIKVYMGDAREVIAALPAANLGRVFILFPDPWPKTRHHKRRFIQMELLDELARVMKPGAELRFASDDAGYVEWTLERALAHPSFEWTAARASDWKTRPPDWPPTRYEAKALHGPPAYLRFVRSALS